MQSTAPEQYLHFVAIENSRRIWHCTSLLVYTLFYLKQRLLLFLLYVCLEYWFTQNRDCLTCKPGWNWLRMPWALFLLLHLGVIFVLNKNCNSGGQLMKILGRRLRGYTYFILSLIWIISCAILIQTSSSGVRDTVSGVSLNFSEFSTSQSLMCM